MSLWSAQEAAEATGGRAEGNWSASGVSIDTRTLRPGDLFVALSAARDGHDFVADALSKGAAAAMVSRRPDGVGADAPLLLVDDVQSGLEALGRAARDRSRARVVAVTGSVGKTSVKEMLRVMLAAQGTTHAAEASYNNHWGVPLTLARLPADADFAVLEIGMNSPGEIAPLAGQARPHVALVTAIAPAHLEALGSLAAIAREKASIFEGLQPGGAAIFNEDMDIDGILRAKAEECAVTALGYGENSGEWRLETVQLTDTATVVQANAGGAQRLIRLAAPGRHFAINALGALAAAEALGADPALALLGLGNWHPPAGRGSRLVIPVDRARDGGDLTVIDDAFNANPASMAAAFEVLAATAPVDGVGRVARGRRVAFLGDMLELGVDEMDQHAALAQLPQMSAVSVVHCAGPRMRALWEALPEGQRGQWTADARALAQAAGQLVDAGDVALVKGSKGSEVSRVVDALRKLGQQDAPRRGHGPGHTDDTPDGPKGPSVGTGTDR